MTCKGCGIKLQYDDRDKVGYSPKENAQYCQRCFRIKHYDDLMYSMKTGIKPDEVLKKINEIDGLVVWVCDLFDFEASMIEGMNRHLVNKDIILVASKRDLLPNDISDLKITNFIKGILKENGIKVNAILITSKEEKNNGEQIVNVLKEQANGKPIIVVGKANVGKSTFLNLLSSSDVLTKSKYPGTTLDFNEIIISNQVFIDTPGIEVKNSMLMLLDEKQLSCIIPQSRIKPLIYQLEKDQSIALGGLIRIDLFNCNKASLVVYASDRLVIHRSKQSNADDLWANHKGVLLIPSTDDKMVTTTAKAYYDKMDIVIDGLGWVSINSNVSSIKITHPKDVNIRFRKAML